MHSLFSQAAKTVFLCVLVAMITLSTSSCGSIKVPNYLSALTGGDSTKDDTIRPRGDMFSRYLYEGYRRQGRKEDMQHDYEDAEYYVLKSQAAARGEHVSPQHILERDIPAFALPELSYSRARLDWALNNNARVYFAEETAEAQVMFDCWLEQQEENIQQHDIDECRKKFLRLIAYIEASYQINGPDTCPAVNTATNQCGGMVPPVAVSQCNKPAALTKPLGDKDLSPICDQAPTSTLTKHTAPTHFNFMFLLDSTDLVSASRDHIDAIVALTQQYNVDKITLSGHTDRSGSQDHNRALSARRVEKIRMLLYQHGVASSLVEDAYFGENLPKLHTPDGQREPMNRRVEATVYFRGNP